VGHSSILTTVRYLQEFSDQKNYEYYLTTALDYYDNYSSDDGTVVIRFHNRDFGLIP